MNKKELQQLLDKFEARGYIISKKDTKGVKHYYVVEEEIILSPP